MNLETKEQEKFYLIGHKLHDKQFHKRLLCAFLKNEVVKELFIKKLIKTNNFYYFFYLTLYLYIEKGYKTP